MDMQLYPPSNAFLEEMASKVVRIEAHDGDDAESADLLWVEYTPDDPTCEGLVIFVSPFGVDGLWHGCLEDINRYGGTVLRDHTNGEMEAVVSWMRSLFA